MTDVRRKTPAFVYGDYKDVDPGNPQVFAYTRSIGAEQYLVVVNFSTETITYSVPGGIQAKQLLISNLSQTSESGAVLHLKGWEARVYKL